MIICHLIPCCMVAAFRACVMQRSNHVTIYPSKQSIIVGESSVSVGKLTRRRPGADVVQNRLSMCFIAFYRRICSWLIWGTLQSNCRFKTESCRFRGRFMHISMAILVHHTRLICIEESGCDQGNHLTEHPYRDMKTGHCIIGVLRNTDST